MEEKMDDIEKVIEVGYEMEDIKLCLVDLVKLFEVLENRRNIRHTQVESILASLKAGKHFDSPMVVNKVNGKYRIIDGNHRYEALRMYLSTSKTKVTVRLAVYSHLTEKQEAEMYIRWNGGIKQTIDDLLQLRKTEIPIYKILQDENFPVAIYRSTTSNSVQLAVIIKMLYCSLNTEEIFSPHMPHRTSIVDIAKGYDESDAAMVIQFFSVFREAIGDFRNNKFLRSVFCVPLFNVYMLNTWFKREELVERFNKCLSDTELMQRLSEHSRDAMLLIRERIFQLGDRGKKQKFQRGVRRVGEDGKVEV